MNFTIHCSKHPTDGDISEHGNRVRELGRRLRIVTDIPAVHQYVQLELSVPRRTLAVLGESNKSYSPQRSTNHLAVSAFEDFRRNVREEVLIAARDNIRLFELDYQPVQSLDMQGGSAA